MSAYVLIEITVHDRDMYLQYIQQAKPIVLRHGGEYIIRGGEITPMFGDWNPERIILIRFPSRESISECFGSDEYLRVAPLRENSTITRSIILDGYDAT